MSHGTLQLETTPCYCSKRKKLSYGSKGKASYGKVIAQMLVPAFLNEKSYMETLAVQAMKKEVSG